MKKILISFFFLTSFFSNSIFAQDRNWFQNFFTSKYSDGSPIYDEKGNINPPPSDSSDNGVEISYKETPPKTAASAGPKPEEGSEVVKSERFNGKCDPKTKKPEPKPFWQVTSKGLGKGGGTFTSESPTQGVPGRKNTDKGQEIKPNPDQKKVPYKKTKLNPETGQMECVPAGTPSKNIIPKGAKAIYK